MGEGNVKLSSLKIWQNFMPNSPITDTKQPLLGFWAAFVAFVIWGALVFYWKPLGHVPPLDTVAHRIFWSLLTILPITFFMHAWLEIRATLHAKKTMLRILVAACVLSVNWLLYIWAVTNERIIEASLGYFINPLVSVLLGRIFLKEKMTRLQIFAIGIAFLGVGYGVWAYGQVPYVGLCLAFTFALYGYCRKTVPVSGLSGLFLETLCLFPMAIIWIFWQEFNSPNSFFEYSASTQLLLMGTGIITTTPLLLFAMASKNISLASLGLLQYIAPTLKLFIGVFIFGEIISESSKVTLIFVWTALVIYSWCSIRQWHTLPHQKTKRT